MMKPIAELIAPILATLMMIASGRAAAETIEVEVNGLVCAFCAQGIEKALKRLPATRAVFVSLEHRLVAVATGEGESIDDADLRAAITDAGYTTVAIRRTEERLDSIRDRVLGEEAADED